MSGDAPSPLARALGRMPQGLYVVTTGSAEAPLGFVASLVQQVGFDPPTVCVAVSKGRDHVEAIRAAGGFTVSILDGESSGLMGPFFSKREDGSSYKVVGLLKLSIVSIQECCVLFKIQHK